MSGPKPDYPINLTEAERTNLEELVRAQKSAFFVIEMYMHNERAENSFARY